MYRLYEKIKTKGYYFLISIFYFLQTSIAFARHGGLVPACDPVAPRGEPRCDLCDLLDLGKHVIEWLVQIALVLAVVFIIWGGFIIMTAGGNVEKVTQGRKTMTIALVGVAIILGSWLIIGTLLNILTGSESALPWTQIQCR